MDLDIKDIEHQVLYKLSKNGVEQCMNGMEQLLKYFAKLKHNHIMYVKCWGAFNISDGLLYRKHCNAPFGTRKNFVFSLSYLSTEISKWFHNNS